MVRRRQLLGLHRVALVAGGLTAILLLSTLFAPGLLPNLGSSPPASGTFPDSPSTGSPLSSLSSSPLAPVHDSEPGIDLPGAVDLGPAHLPHMTILVGFPLSHEGNLLEFLTLLSDLHSSSYHHYLTQAEFDERYGGAPGPYQLAVQYFGSFGVANLTTSADHLVITFRASSSQV